MSLHTTPPGWSPARLGALVDVLDVLEACELVRTAKLARGPQAHAAYGTALAGLEAMLPALLDRLAATA